jgi:ATP-dependent protease ClpP protease subunit
MVFSLNDKEGDKNEKEPMRTVDESGIFCLSIIGQIEGHYSLDANTKTTKYDHVIPLLVSLEESESVKGVLIVLNTLGGDVEAGLAIAELISSMSKPTASIVLGGGHSIGVPLAVSARRSFIVPSATMTIHPVRTSGLVLGVSQAFDYLEKMQDRIIRFITSHSEIEDGYLRQIMHRTDVLVNDIGSILEGEDAVRCGLINEIGGVKEAIADLTKPDEVVAAANAYLSGNVKPATLYKSGQTYYYFDVQHLGNLTDSETQIGEYGIVRNHIYAININSIGGYGSPIYIGTSNIVTPPEYPDDPTGEETSFVSAEVRILSWRIVSQGVDIQPNPEPTPGV